MMSMEKISAAILDKVRAEAQDIIKEAEEKAGERVEKAKRQREAKLEEEKNRLIERAEGEASRILAQASIRARQELLARKTEVIDEIVKRVKEVLAGQSGDEHSPLNLIKEAIDTLGVDKVRVYVSPKDLATVKKLIKEDKKLGSKITEIKESDLSGGVMVEDIKGKIRIDNSYDTRLETLLPQILPEISKELFGKL